MLRLCRVTGSVLGIALLASAPASSRDEPAMLGGGPHRNNVRGATGLPTDWDLRSGRGVRWRVELGSETFGGPTVADGKVFVGTNNAKPRDEAVIGDRSVVYAFEAATGRFLWQSTHEKLAEGRSQDWPEQGVCSTPAVVGDRLYYLSNRAQVVALDTEGYADGEDDGVAASENDRGAARADVVWSVDLRSELGVIPHFMASSSPLVVGDSLYVISGNGIDERHGVPAPGAPSFVALDRHSGKVLWSDASPGDQLLEGGWSSPTRVTAGGTQQIVFPGADGVLHAFDAETGRPVWKFDANAGEGESRIRHSFIGIASFADRLYVGAGRNPEGGGGPGKLWALEPVAFDPAAEGLGEPRVVWSVEGKDFAHTLSAPVVHEGLVYAADLAGFLSCFDAETGERLWRYDTFAAVWGSPLVADGKVYLGDEDGDLVVLRAGRSREVLAELNLGDGIYTTPTAEDGVLYVATRSALFAFESVAAEEASDDGE